MAIHADFAKETPKEGETSAEYGARLEKEGARELYMRKALRTHFDLTLAEVIDAGRNYPEARHRELVALRQRFPELNENRFAWRITKSLTIDKEDALVWAQTILATETED